MADNEYGKQLRLLSAQDFLFLRSGSKRVKTNYLMAYYKTKPQQEQTRIGLSLSKKVGNAVVRNRYKRIIREEFRTTSLWKSMGIDILIVVSPYLLKNLETKYDGEKRMRQGLKELMERIGGQLA